MVLYVFVIISLMLISHRLICLYSAINSDESGPRNFTAFQNLAGQLNGTASASAPSATQTKNNGAMSIRMGGVGFTLLLGAFIAFL
jgi:hypothetical protein